MQFIILEQELKDYRIPVYEKIDTCISDKVLLYYWKKKSNTSFNVLNEKDVNVKCKGISVLRLKDKLFLPNYFFKNIFKKNNTVLVRGNIRNLFLIPILILGRLKGINIIVSGHGYSKNRTFKPYSNILDFLYLLIIKLSNAYVVYDENTQAKLRQYVKSNKIFVANNTLDTDKEFNYLKQFEKNGITKIKKELGINYSLTLGFIGRLTKRKELDYLLDVFQALNKEFKNTGLYIIGKGSEYDDIANKIKNDKINNAYLIGPKYNYEAAKFLYAIDIIIIPWAVGLTVNHALIYGTPVISQCKDGEFIGHGPEVIHIKHKFNGWIAEYNNKQDMIQGIHEIINNYNFYSQNAAKYARENLTIDIMIQGFTEAYEYVKNK